MHVIDKKDLAGLPEDAIEAAGSAAKVAGLDGWVFNVTRAQFNSVYDLRRKSRVRKKLWFGNASKAYKDGNDNSQLCIQIAGLRHDRAELLGYKTHANFVLEERMAESPEKVTAFLERLLEKSLPAGKRDIEQVRKLKLELTGDAEFMPWDYGFYSEKLKMRDYDFDEEQLRPYFKLENVINGVFEHARQLYGLVFKPIKGVPTYHPDVQTFEVADEKTGQFIGLFYADFFPRKSKRNGAWMTSFRDQGLWLGKVVRRTSASSVISPSRLRANHLCSRSMKCVRFFTSLATLCTDFFRTANTCRSRALTCIGISSNSPPKLWKLGTRKRRARSFCEAFRNWRSATGRTHGKN